MRLTEVLKDSDLYENIKVFDYEVDLFPGCGEYKNVWSSKAKSPQGFSEYRFLGASQAEIDKVYWYARSCKN